MSCVSKFSAVCGRPSRGLLQNTHAALRRIKPHLCTSLTSAVVVCLLASAAHLPQAVAGDSLGAAAKSENAADPRVASAAAALRRMHSYLREATDLEFRTTVRDAGEVKALGKSGSARFQIRKPNLFRVEAAVDGQTTIYVSDGKILTVFRPRSGKYMQLPARDTIIGTMYGATGILAQQARIVDFFWTVDYLEAVGEDVRVLDRGAVEKIAGQECRKFSVDRMDDSWDVWIAQGDLPLPCKLISRRRDTSAQVQSNVFTWTADPKFTTGDFEFTPPAGTRLVEDYELD